MPDFQSTASFIGNFLQGYMGQMAQDEKNKLEKVHGLLSVAESHRRTAESPDSIPEVQSAAAENFTKVMTEVDKMMNQKTSNLSSLMKIFKFGKKGKDGSVSAPPPEMFKPPSNVPYASPTSLQAMGIPLPGEGAQDGTKKPPTSEMSGLNAVMQRRLEAERIKNEQAQKTALATATQTADINLERQKNLENWKTIQSRTQSEKDVEDYRNSEEYKSATPDERMGVINHIRYGIPYRETPHYRERTVIGSDGVARTEVIDVSQGGKPVTESWEEPPSQQDLSAIMDYMITGKAKTFDEARKMFADARINERGMAAKSKNLGISLQAELLESRQTRNELLKLKKSGQFGVKEALSLYKAAIAHGERMLRSDPTSVAMDETTKNRTIDSYARQYVEGSPGQEGFMTWEELRKSAGSAPGTTAQEEANRYRGPQPATTPGTILKPPK